MKFLRELVFLFIIVGLVIPVGDISAFMLGDADPFPQ